MQVETRWDRLRWVDSRQDDVSRCHPVNSAKLSGAQTFVHQSLPLPQNKVLNMMTWHPHVDWLNPVFGWASLHQLNHPPFGLICLKFVIPWKQAKIPNPCELPNHPGTQIVYMPDMAAGGEHLWSRSPACPSQATSCFHLTSSLTSFIPNSSWTSHEPREEEEMLQQMLLSGRRKQSTAERFVGTKDCSFGKSHSQKVRQNTTVYTRASISKQSVWQLRLKPYQWSCSGGIRKLK